VSVKVWEIGEQFGVSNLRLVERDEEQPGPGQVRIRTEAISLNYRDWMVISGAYNPRQPLPHIPLSDAVGRIDAVGPGVERVRVGDRVAAIFAQRWLSGPPDKTKVASALGSPLPGVAREAFVVDAEGVVAVPSYLSNEEAATLPCAAVTAWVALFEQGAVRPGQSVLIQGTGGVSMFALAFAKMAGATTIVTSSSDAKLERAHAIGAVHAINYRREPEWGKKARSLSGDGVDHVVEVGGAGTIEQSLAAVRIGGTISVIGVLRGASGALPLTRILMNMIRLQGVFVGPRDAFERMNRALEASKLRPIVDRVFPFDELPAALERIESGAHVGKIVLRV
jgi:NADPH:quinone reductase-like Zn-dependent oxidoreductase